MLSSSGRWLGRWIGRSGLRRRRLFIVESELADLSSHHFNQVLGFKLAAEERGLVPHVLLHQDANRALAQSLDARRVIKREPPAAAGDELEAFADHHRRLRSLWDALDETNPSRDDFVLMTAGRPGTIYSLGAWLSERDPQHRPAVFIRFYDHDYIDLATGDFTRQSPIYRFAARDLALRPGQDRVFFTANNPDLVGPLGLVCDRRVFHMPLPKHYGAVVPAQGSTSAPVIYLHMNARCGTMLNQIQRAIRLILDARPDAKVLLKYCLNALRPGLDATLAPDLAARGVELVAPEQSHADYLDTIARSHIVVLPYDVEAYRGLASGVFAESAALGRVTVYPEGSWMADQVDEGHAAGVSFAETSQHAIVSAVLEAIETLPDLLQQASERASAFREQNSCGRNLDMMLALAAERHDMSARYVPGTRVKFGEGTYSRGNMLRGWSFTEAGGVWTDGPLAELSLRLDASCAGALTGRFRLVPFVAAGRPQAVTVFINGIKSAEWLFPPDTEFRDVSCTVDVPASIASSGQLSIRMQVKHPLSPAKAGLSADERLLGILLREIRFDRAADTVSRLDEAAASPGSGRTAA